MFWWRSARSGAAAARVTAHSPRCCASKVLLFRSYRAHSRRAHPPDEGQTVIWSILGVNSIVFGAWMYARERARSGDYGMYRLMMQHFTSGEPNLRSGRWWTLLSASFSHQETWHFIINMATFAFTAPALVPLIGAPNLVAMYVGSGLAASLTSITLPYVVDPVVHREHASLARKRYTLSQGASGA